MMGGDFTVDEVQVLWPEKLASRLTTDASTLTPLRVEVIHRLLANALSSA